MADSKKSDTIPSSASGWKFALPTFDLPIPRLMPRDPVLAIVLMFIAVQLLAIPAGIILINSSKTSADVASLSVAPTGSADNPLNALFFVGYVLVGAVGILLVIRYMKSNRLWLRELLIRLLEFSVVSGSVAILLFAYLDWTGMEFFSALGLSTLAGFLFGVCKLFIPRLKNAAAVLSSAGVGALFGFSMGFWPALFFIVALALYDYIAVFQTRHMLAMAQALGTKGLAFTITADSNDHAAPMPSAAPANSASKSNAPSASRPLTTPSTASRPAAHAASAPPAPSRVSRGIDRLDLGSGDLAIPAMLAVSTYTIAGLPGAIAVLIGTSVAIILTLRLVVDKRVALPALPPICLGGLLALLIVKLAGF